MKSTTKQQNNEITTIKLSKKTKARLDNLKTYKRETYEDTISKILGILNLCKVNPAHAKSKLLQINRQKLFK